MLTTSANALVISWNCSVNGTVTNFAGINLVSNWNNSTTARTDLTNSAGTPTTMDIAPNSLNTYSIGGTPAQDSDGTDNKRMLNGYLNAGSVVPPPSSTVALTQIPYGQYTIYVYFSSDVTGRTGTVNVASTTYSFSAVGAPSISGGNAMFTETTDTAGGNPSANFAIFTNLTGVSQTITCTIPDFGGIAGFQVVDTTPVGIPPTVNTQPASFTNYTGHVASLSVVASGSAPLSYQWYYTNGAPATPLTGKTNATVTFNPLSTNDVGSYFAVITNLYGSVTSSVATVGAIQVPLGNGVGISWNCNQSGTVQAGTGVAGIYAVSNWNNSTGPISDLINSLGTVTTMDIALSALNYVSIGGTPGQDSDGTYNRNMLNGYMNAGSAVPPPSSTVALTQIPYNQYTLYVYFSSDVTGRTGTVNVASTTYTFSTVGAPSISGGNAAFTETTDTAGGNPSANFAIFTNLTGVSQTITCTIPDFGGIAGFQIVDTTPPGIPPTVSTQPVDTTNYVGLTASLSVGVSGSAPLSYQWYSTNGGPATPLTGKTNGTLSFSPLSTNDTGSYFAVITNFYGSVTSTVAKVVAVIVPSGNGVAVSWNCSIDGTVQGIAGLYAVSNWNNGTVSSSDLTNSLGAVTTMDIAVDPLNYYSVSGFDPGQDSDGTYNRAMLNGYLNAGPAAPAASSTVALTQIPYSQYTIYVYFSSDVGGRIGTINVGATTYSFSAVGSPSVSGGNAALTETTDTGAGNPAANFAIFTGLTGDSQTITCTFVEYGGIAGFQIVDTTSVVIPPTILYNVTSTNLNLTWPSTGFVLQTQSNSNNVAGLNGAGWVDVSGSSSVTNYTIQIDHGLGNQFFRLRTAP